MDEAQNIIEHLRFTRDYWIIVVPCILMGLDIATGFVNAWAKHRIKSAIMRQGLARKFGELVVIGIAQLFLYSVGLPKVVVSGVSFYIGIMELISICENLDKLGVPIPKFIKAALHDAEDKLSREKEGGEADEKSDDT